MGEKRSFKDWLTDLLGTSKGYDHYKTGDDMPISRDRNYSSSKRQKRWRRRRLKMLQQQRRERDLARKQDHLDD